MESTLISFKLSINLSLNNENFSYKYINLHKMIKNIEFYYLKAEYTDFLEMKATNVIYRLVRLLI